jgi:CoA:oxalate CoA-transferase
LGEIVVPTTPLRVHGTDKLKTRPSSTIGQHNAEIYGGRLGLSPTGIAELQAASVI